MMEELFGTGTCASCGKEIEDANLKVAINDHSVCLDCARVVSDGEGWATLIDGLLNLNLGDDTEELADYESEEDDDEEEEDFEQWEEEGDAQDED